MKNYYQFINEEEMFGLDVDLDNPILYDLTEDEVEEEYLKTLEKKGQLHKYIKSEHKKLHFGMLKAFYHDAIAYKEKREYTKGAYKFVHRIVPMILAPIFYPIWILSWILGSTRALNKILTPVLKKSHNNYNGFLHSFITTTMDIVEGEAEVDYIVGKDWFYDIFYMRKGLVEMVRKEYLLEFSKFLANKMEKEPDDELVPNHYIENEFIKWLNLKFKIKIEPKN